MWAGPISVEQQFSSQQGNSRVWKTNRILDVGQAHIVKTSQTLDVAQGHIVKPRRIGAGRWLPIRATVARIITRRGTGARRSTVAIQRACSLDALATSSRKPQAASALASWGAGQSVPPTHQGGVVLPSLQPQ
jgi:hypothetical protein